MWLAEETQPVRLRPVSGADYKARTMLVRSAGLAGSMSRYLIRRIEETATITLRPYTEIVALEGGDHLESVRWRNSQTGETEEHKISHVFVMTGADPNTRWLDGQGYARH